MSKQFILMLLCGILALSTYYVGVLTARWVAPWLQRMRLRAQGSGLDEAQLYALYEAKLFDRALDLCDKVLEKHPIIQRPFLTADWHWYKWDVSMRPTPLFLL